MFLVRPARHLRRFCRGSQIHNSCGVILIKKVQSLADAPSLITLHTTDQLWNWTWGYRISHSEWLKQMRTISKKEERQIKMNTKVFSQWNLGVHLCHDGIMTSQGQRELLPFSHESRALNLHGIKYRIVNILSLIDVKHHKEESGEQRERGRENSILSTPLLAYAEDCGKGLYFPGSDNEDFFPWPLPPFG